MALNNHVSPGFVSIHPDHFYGRGKRGPSTLPTSRFGVPKHMAHLCGPVVPRVYPDDTSARFGFSSFASSTDQAISETAEKMNSEMRQTVAHIPLAPDDPYLFCTAGERFILFIPAAE